MKVTIGNYASYIEVKPWDESFKPLKTKDLGNGIYLDYTKDGELIGIEILFELVPEYYSDYKKKEEKELAMLKKLKEKYET
jgi:uncharacterized protein YuzE